MRILKQSTAFELMVFMTDSADHVSGKTGLTLTITASKAGAAFASISPSVTERGSGWYDVSLTTSHTDTVGDLALHVTGTGADPADLAMTVRANVLGDTLPANATQFAGQTITAAAGVTLPSTVASPTNITAGTITTVTNLTNAPSDSSGTTTLLSRLSSARAGYLDNLSAGAAALESSLQGLITTIGASAAGVATAVWSAVTRTLTAGTNIALAKGTGVTGFNDPTAAANASAVRTELATELGRVDAAVSTRATDAGTAAAITSDHGSGSYIRNTEPPTAIQNRAEMDSNSTRLASIDGKTTNLPSDPADQSLIIAATNALASAIAALNDLSEAELQAAVLATVYENGESFQAYLRLTRAALVGKSNGFGASGASAGHFRGAADGANRITVASDEFGNRTTVTTDAA